MSLVTDIRVLLDESSAIFWTDAQVYNAANEAQIDVWASSKWDIGSVNFVTNPASPTISPDIFSFDTTVIMIPEYFVLNSLVFFPTTMAKLEQYLRNWKDTTAGQPRWFAQFDAERFRVYPKPDVTYTFSLFGIKWPATEVSASATDITAPELIKRAVQYRAVARLMYATRPDLTKNFNELAEGFIQEFNRQTRNTGGHRIFRLRPLVDPRRDQTMLAQSGVIKLGRGLK